MHYPHNSFVSVAQRLIVDADLRFKLGDCSKTLPRDYRQRLNAYCKPFFGKMLVKDVSYSKLREFNSYLADRKISSSTIRTILSFASKVLDQAAKEELITRIPPMPRPKQIDCPRPSLSDQQYKHLLSILKDIENGKPKVEFKGHVVDKELRHIVTFMVNCFLRPSDLFVLRHGHIDIVDEGPTGRQFLSLDWPSSKGHSAPTVSLKQAVAIYRNILSRRLASGFGRPSDYVFLPDVPNREYAKEIVRRQFAKVLDEAGLRVTIENEARSLYSLRHYAITDRIVNADGLDTVTLAKNCRTSVEMIDRFYASRYQPAQNVDIIQSDRRQKRGTIAGVPSYAFSTGVPTFFWPPKRV